MHRDSGAGHRRAEHPPLFAHPPPEAVFVSVPPEVISLLPRMRERRRMVERGLMLLRPITEVHRRTVPLNRFQVL